MPRFLRIALAVVATLLALVMAPAASTAMSVAETTNDPYGHAYDHPSSHAAPLAEVPSVRVRHPAEGASARSGDFGVAADTAADLGKAEQYRAQGIRVGARVGDRSCPRVRASPSGGR